MATVAHAPRTSVEEASPWWSVLQLMGSLKLTVALFAASIVLVLVGTLAQDEQNMLDVKRQYFSSVLAYVPLDVFVPQPFHPHDEPIASISLSDGRVVPLGFPFPGGATIGVLLLANLLAAKVTRFKVMASGGRRTAGVALSIIGLALMFLVIIAGHNSDGLQGQPPVTYDTFWTLMRFGVGVSCVAVAWAAATAQRPAVRRLLGGAAVMLGLLTALVFLGGQSVRLSDPGMRILWQLTQGLVVAVVLQGGFWLLFAHRGGNALLHFGVALLMIGQFAFGDQQLEQRLSLKEGEVTNVLRNLDAVELALIDRSGAGSDEVIGIRGRSLQEALNAGEPIRDPRLPVDVEVLAYYKHSTLKRASEAKEKNLADRGFGLEYVALPQRPAGGAESEMNLASAYVRLIERESGEPLGTYLVSQLLSDFSLLAGRAGASDDYDQLEVGGKTYDLGLQFERVAKPYWIQLEDVRRVNYSGTDTPRDYSSFVRLVDPETGEDRRERIWMNNPLRYRGETFYQSSYTPLPDGTEMTGIQVVRNVGWLIPYVACMIVAVGMVVHFWGTLIRFLGRREREVAKLPPPPRGNRRAVWVPLAVVGGLAMLSAVKLFPWSPVQTALRPTTRDAQMDYYRAGEIPVSYGGRVKPLDAFARQTLKAISNRESLDAEDLPQELQARVRGSRLSALQWLMEVASGDPIIGRVQMFRIDADEVLDELELVRRSSKLYSLTELMRNVERFSAATEQAKTLDEAELNFKQRKLLELERRTQVFMLAAEALREPQLPELPSPEAMRANPEAAAAQLGELRRISQRVRQLEQFNPPAILPPADPAVDSHGVRPDWHAFAPIAFDRQLNRLIAEAQGQDAEAALGPAPPGLTEFKGVVEAYASQDPLAYNEAVDRHLAAVQELGVADYDPARVGLERWMEAAAPEFVGVALYIVALVMALVNLMVRSLPLRRAVTATLLLTLAIHTASLVFRVLITGRPPVINLYSSAVFIGWAGVLFFLGVERVYGRGIGNLLAATSGMLALMVAYGLDQGDTMPVLQAVLDTQFWLGTHVVIVTLGYGATFAAGLLGIAYIATRAWHHWMGHGREAPKVLNELYRMTYGAVCFAIPLSFIGTVLGGLWADDSWGRFWGWDPKENGALLIVLWNALVLHARWDGMVGPRGFSLLAIVGNIVTAWSWFGTNELGIGLHSYGFTSGVLMLLSLFVASQLLIIGGGWLLTRGGPPQPRLDGEGR